MAGNKGIGLRINLQDEIKKATGEFKKFIEDLQKISNYKKSEVKININTDKLKDVKTKFEKIVKDLNAFSKKNPISISFDEKMVNSLINKMKDAKKKLAEDTSIGLGGKSNDSDSSKEEKNAKRNLQLYEDYERRKDRIRAEKATKRVNQELEDAKNVEVMFERNAQLRKEAEEKRQAEALAEYEKYEKHKQEIQTETIAKREKAEQEYSDLWNKLENDKERKLQNQQEVDAYSKAKTELNELYNLKTKLLKADELESAELRKQITSQEKLVQESQQQLSVENKQILANRENLLKNKYNVSLAKTNDSMLNGGQSIFAELEHYVGIASAMFLAFNKLKEGLNFINDLNKDLTEISIVTGQNQQNVNNLAISYNNLAKEMRATTSEVAKASVEFYRQGLGQQQVMERLEATTKYAKISNLDFTESAKILTATVNSMGIDINKASDTFAYLGDQTATGADEVGKAYQIVGGSAKALNVDFDKMSSYIATLSSRTRESAETIGNSMKAMLARYQQLKEKGFDEEDGTQVNQVAKALDTIGIKIIDTEGNFRNFGTVMDELGAKWGTLENRQRAYISTSMAGSHQSARFMNLMEGYKDSVDLYNGALESAGATQVKYNLWLDGTEAHMNTLKATAEGLWIHMYDSESIKNGIDGLTALVNIVDKVTQTIGGIPMVLTTVLVAMMIFKEKLRAINLTDVMGVDGVKKSMTTGWGVDIFNNFKLLGMYMKSAREESEKMGKSIGLFGSLKVGMRELTGATIGQKLAQIGLNAAMAVGNALISLGIGVAIGFIVTQISHWINHTKELTEANKDLLNTVQQNTLQNSNNIQTLQSISAEYDSLRNRTQLTVEEQKRYHELNNQIAQMSPEVVSGYDEQGNAMINLKNGTKDLVEILKQKNQLENDKLIANGDKAFEQFTNDVKDARTQLEALNKEREIYNNGGIVKTFDAGSHGETKNVSKEGLKQLNARYDGISDKSSTEAKALRKEIDGLNASLVNNNSLIEIQRAKLNQAKQQFDPYIQAIIKNKKEFSSLSDEGKKAVNTLAQSFDASKMKSFDDILTKMSGTVESLATPQSVESITQIEKLTESYRSGKISLNDYNAEVDKLITFLHNVSNIPEIDLRDKLGADPSKIETVYSRTKSVAEVLEEVAKASDSASKSIQQCNQILDKHAKTSEWDLKALMDLSAEYPQLLDLLSDDKALEQELIKIKQQKVDATKVGLNAQMNMEAQFINNLVGGYGVDVNNFANAEEAKSKITQQAVRARINMYKQQLSSLESLDLASRSIAQQNAILASMMWAGDNQAMWEVNGYNMVNTAIDRFFAFKKVSDNLGSMLGNVGGSDYDGKSNGGSSQSQAQNEAERNATDLEKAIVSALKKQYDEDTKNKIDALKTKEDAEVEYYNGRVKQLQDEIDALQDNTQEEKDNLTKLKDELSKWKKDDSVYAQQKIQELEKQIKEKEKNLLIKDKQDQAKALQDELKAKQDAYQKEQDALQLQHDNQVTDEKLYGEARTLIANNTQTEILSLLTKYEPDFAGVGGLLGQSFADAMLSKIREGLKAVSDLKNGTVSPSPSSSGSGGSSSSNSGGSIPWDGKYHQYGEQSEAVRRIQSNLGITADGIWGRQTDKAVRDFQRNNGLSVDGIVGNMTWSKLIKFHTGGLGVGEGMAIIQDKERVLSSQQTKAFDYLTYNILPSFANAFSGDGIKSTLGNIFNAPIIQNDINVTNYTPFDVNNNTDNINKVIKNELRASGYKLNLA